MIEGQGSWSVEDTIFITEIYELKSGIRSKKTGCFFVHFIKNFVSKHCIILGFPFYKWGKYFLKQKIKRFFESPCISASDKWVKWGDL